MATHDHDALAVAHAGAHAGAHGGGLGEASHHGPSTKTYLIVAAILAVITVVEVWAYYTPLVETAIFVPALLIMSAAKFFTVVAFYMHLKYDHAIFRILFYGPFIVAIGTILALLLLFSHKAV
jgi:cytochrome c oxidase subunit 4